MISEFSQNVDGYIAKFRIDSINHEICDSDMDPNTISKAYQLRSGEIQFMLAEILDKQFVEEAVGILTAIIRPSIEKDSKNFYDNLMDFIIESKYTKAEQSKMVREIEYEQLELSTIMKKGQRKNTI